MSPEEKAELRQDVRGLLMAICIVCLNVISCHDEHRIANLEAQIGPRHEHIAPVNDYIGDLQEQVDALRWRVDSLQTRPHRVVQPEPADR